MLGFAAVNILILLPLAFWAERQEGLGWTIAGLVYAILATVALLSGAGRPEASGQRGHDSSGGKDNAERGQG
jgi:cytochrome c oxidase assembly factor CtaG